MLTSLESCYHRLGPAGLFGSPTPHPLRCARVLPPFAALTWGDPIKEAATDRAPRKPRAQRKSAFELQESRATRYPNRQWRSVVEIWIWIRHDSCDGRFQLRLGFAATRERASAAETEQFRTQRDVSSAEEVARPIDPVVVQDESQLCRRVRQLNGFTVNDHVSEFPRPEQKRALLEEQNEQDTQDPKSILRMSIHSTQRTAPPSRINWSATPAGCEKRRELLSNARSDTGLRRFPCGPQPPPTSHLR